MQLALSLSLRQNTESNEFQNKVQNDLNSHSLTLTEAVNMAQNGPLWRLLAISEHGSEPATLEAAGYE